jgi:hypothetical protein
VDTQYTRIVRELTPTDPRWTFTTELVDYLPASPTVPTPLAVLGYVPGAIGRLSHVADVNRYFRALAAASPRVRLFPLGTSDEGREMLVAAIADDSVLARSRRTGAPSPPSPTRAPAPTPSAIGSCARPSRPTGSPGASTRPRWGSPRC